MPSAAVPPRLDGGDLRARLEGGAVLVDLRDPRVFGAGHVPGSINVWVDSTQFAERVAWFTPPGRPLLLLGESEGDARRAVSALARVGLDDVAGYAVGTETVRAAGLLVATLPNITVEELARRRRAERELVVLDVREPSEWAEGHVPGALHIPMREVADRLPELPRGRRIAVVCRAGHRSSLVGSLLLGRGFPDLLNVWGGMTAWAAAGLPTER